MVKSPHPDLLAKLKAGTYPLKSPKRKAVLEEVALYVQYKPAPFLRHFGFVQAIGTSINTLEKDSQELCLYILMKLAKDPILAREIVDEGMFASLKKFIGFGDLRLKVMGLSAIEPLCLFEDIKEKIGKKEVLSLVVLMNEFTLTNYSHGIALLWSIFCKVSSNKEARRHLNSFGGFRLVSQSIDFSHSQTLANKILQTCKNICQDHEEFLIKTGPKFIGNLLSLIGTCSQENLLLIVELLRYTGIEVSDKVHKELCQAMIQKVLEVGISSANAIKFAILEVVETMFSKKNSVIANQMNSERIMLLIISALNHGEIPIKETASKLTLKMVVTENVGLSKEPDLLNLVLLNCKLLEDEYFTLRRLSIEIIFRMAVSVRYVKLIILNAHAVLDMAKTAFSILHPEISSGAQQASFILFDRVRIDEGAADHETVSLKEEEMVAFAGKLQGYKDRVIQDINLRKVSSLVEEVKYDFNPKDADDQDSESEAVEAHVAGQAISMSKEEAKIVNISKQLIEHFDGVCKKIAAKRIDAKGSELYLSTYHLVKLITVLLSCDITYSKIFSLSLHAVCGIILEKAIGARVDSPQAGNGRVRLDHHLLLHALRRDLLPARLQSLRRAGRAHRTHLEQVRHQDTEDHKERTRRRDLDARHPQLDDQPDHPAADERRDGKHPRGRPAC